MLDIITRLLWICKYARVTFSKSCVSTQFHNHHFASCCWNDTVFISCGLVYRRQGLLGNPLLGSIIPGCGTCHTDKLASHPIPHVATISPFFFPVIILALLLNHIFKIRLLNMLNHPHFQSILLESTIPFIMTCLKTRMFKNSLISICLYGMNVSLKITCMNDMRVYSAAHNICIHSLVIQEVSTSRCHL